VSRILGLLLIVFFAASGCATRDVPHAGAGAAVTDAVVIDGGQPVQAEPSGLSRDGKIALGIAAGGAAVLLVYAVLAVLAASVGLSAM
jgi:hypothetical protein